MWDRLREWYYVFIEPLLVYFGLTTWGHGDPTYGRNALPYSPLEREAIYDNAAVKVTRRRVYLSGGKPVLDTSLGEHITTVPHPWGAQVIDAWVNYYVWEMPNATQRMNADVYLAHGINDYSVCLASDTGKSSTAGVGTDDGRVSHHRVGYAELWSFHGTPCLCA